MYKGTQFDKMGFLFRKNLLERYFGKLTINNPFMTNKAKDFFNLINDDKEHFFLYLGNYSNSQDNIDTFFLTINSYNKKDFELDVYSPLQCKMLKHKEDKVFDYYGLIIKFYNNNNKIYVEYTKEHSIRKVFFRAKNYFHLINNSDAKWLQKINNLIINENNSAIEDAVKKIIHLQEV